MSDTPRTDAEEELMGGLRWVQSDLARALERELAVANEQRAPMPRSEIIDKLTRERDEALTRLSQAKPAWIPVGERLPELRDQGGDELGSEIVLAHWPNDWIGMAQYWKTGGWFWVEQDDGQEADADPTHWMPLPEAP